MSTGRLIAVGLAAGAFDALLAHSPVATTVFFLWLVLSAAARRGSWRFLVAPLPFALWVAAEFALIRAAGANARLFVAAVRQYHDELGGYPVSLDSLVPKYLHDVPLARPLGVGRRFQPRFRAGLLIGDAA